MKNFSPLHDYVLIEKIEKEKKTTGGILIPEKNDEKYFKGLVIETGPGKYNETKDTLKKINLEVNDKVICEKYSGIEIIDGKKKYTLIKEKNIIAKIKN